MRDAEIASWVAGLGIPGLVDLHVHFLPEPVLNKVWAYFDQARAHYGVDWPIQYRFDEDKRLRVLRGFGVVGFAPLVYPHKPGMAEWLNDWVRDFADRTPDAVPTATLFPEPGVEQYLAKALDGGARCVKAHVQVGAYDPRAAELDAAWGLVAEAGVPLVIHCGHGPLRGDFTGLSLFEDVLRRHPRLTAVLAHAGMPEFDLALDLVERYPNVHIDTTMVGVPFSSPPPSGWLSRVADHGDRVALGTDFPNIPYEYATQIDAIRGWDLGDDFLRAVLHDTPARLLGLVSR